MRDRPGAYTQAGIALIGGGLAFALLSWLIIQSVPLTALGLAGVLVGTVCLALEQTLPAIPSEVSVVLLQTGLENVAALLEELGLTARAIYLPGHLSGGRPLALVPLCGDSAWRGIQGALPARLITSYGPGPENVGLLIGTVGTTVAQLLDERPGGSVPELESALTAVVIGRLDLADGIHVHTDEERLVVSVDSPRLGGRDLWSVHSLGSPLASIVATLSAENLRKPVRIRSEEWSNRQAVIVMEPLDASV